MASTGTHQTTQQTLRALTDFWKDVDNHNSLPQGFHVKLQGPNKKRKRQSQVPEQVPAGYKTEDGIFQTEWVDKVYYRVEPNGIWETWTKAYRAFSIGKNDNNAEVSMKTGHYVYVRPDKEQDNATIKGWIAKVLEVRAGDNAHVFLRVLWMYRPEDLPLGRQPYHGEHELIASNAMDVIDAQSVDGKAEVNYWDENEDSTIVLDPTKMFWRQTVDFWGKQKQKQSHTLSAVRRHCIERTPCNPDEGVIQCEHCSYWLHVRCLEALAIKRFGASASSAPESDETAANDTDGASSLAHAANSAKRRASGNSATNVEPSKLVTSSHRGKDLTLDQDISTYSTSADVPEVFAKLETLDDEKSIMTIIDKRPGHKRAYRAPIECVNCHHVIDQGDEGEDLNGAESVGSIEDVIEVGDVDDAGGILPDTSSALVNDEQVSKPEEIEEQHDDIKEIPTTPKNVNVDGQAFDNDTPSRPPASSLQPSITSSLRKGLSSESTSPLAKQLRLRSRTTTPLVLPNTPRSKGRVGKVNTISN